MKDQDSTTIGLINKIFDEDSKLRKQMFPAGYGLDYEDDSDYSRLSSPKVKSRKERKREYTVRQRVLSDQGRRKWMVQKGKANLLDFTDE